ncbi:MAG: murein biosynthesis integral membrane protein MurJ [Microbacteriaceae bacterium]
MADAEISRASAVMASGTLVSRILGFIKAIMVVAVIGLTGGGADAFALANQLPNNVYIIIIGGVLNAILVPQIIKAGLHSDGGAAFINRITTLAIVLFGGATVLATLAAPLLVALYAGTLVRGNADTFALAVSFAYWCLPQIFFYALYTLLGEILNARKLYGPYTWAPVVNNVVAIMGLGLFLAVFGVMDSAVPTTEWTPTQIALLAGPATLGIVVQALMLFFFWRRVGLSYQPDFRWRGVGLGQLGRTASWTFGLLITTQIAGIVQTQVAAIATGSGASIAVMQNAWLIFILPHSIATVSIGTAYFTRMSGHASTGDIVSLRADLSSSVRAISLIAVFSSVGLIVLSVPISRVFTDNATDVLLLAQVVAAFLIGLVPFSIQFVLFRAFYALGDTRTPFLITLFQSGLYIPIAVACAFLPTQFIVLGLALGMSLVTLPQLVLTVYLLRRKVGSFRIGPTMRSLVVFAVASLSAAAIGVLILWALGLFTDGFALESRLSAILTMAAAGGGMALAYSGGLLALGSSEFRGFVDLVRSRLQR